MEQIARDYVLAMNGLVEQKIICFEHNPKSKDSKDIIDGVEITRVGQQALFASQAIGWTYKRRLEELIKAFNPDIILFHYPNPFVCHFLLKLIPKDTKLIVIWHLDIYKQKVLKYFFYRQNRKLLKRSNKVVATSPNYIEGSPWLSSIKDKCIVIPNCIDENRLKVTDEERALANKIREENKGKILCLAVGRHVPYKGFEYLIKASKLLDDRFVIQITGKGPLTKELHKLAASDSKVKFLGLVSDKELKARLISCDIFTFSSITKNEAFGVALAEGMYFSHPAVTFTIPGSGVNYVNLDGVTGIEVPNRNVEKYAAAIKRLADNSELRIKEGQAARERVLNNFLYSTLKKNTIQLLEELS